MDPENRLKYGPDLPSSTSANQYNFAVFFAVVAVDGARSEEERENLFWGFFYTRYKSLLTKRKYHF